MADVYTRDSPMPEPDPEPQRERERARWQRVLRGIGRGLLIALAVVLGLVLLVVLLLQTEFGRQKVENIAVDQIRGLLSDSATVSVERIDGNFLTGAYLIGLEISERGETVITLDTVEIDYNLTTLLDKRLSVGEVYAAGLAVYARQDADSTWNVARLLAPADAADTTATSPGFTVFIDEARIARAAAEVRFYSPRRDSVLTVDGLHARILDFTTGGADGLEGTLDTLWATATPPAPTTGEAGPVRLAGAGAFTAAQTRVDAFLLNSADSDVRASGALDYGDPDRPLTFDVDVQASPLAFSDVRAFAPVEVYGTLDLRLQAQGTPDDILARVDAEFREGGALDLNGVFSAGADGPVRYAAEGTVRNLDPGRILGDPALAGDLTGDLDVDLSGPSLQEIDGRVDLEMSASSFGEQQIQRLDFVGTFDDGLADFTLGGAVPGGKLIARGTARPFAETPTYDLRGELNDIDLARLLSDPSQSGRFSGTFAVEGRGIDPEEMIATASLNLGRTQYGEIDLDRAAVTAALTRGEVRYNADLDFSDGDGSVTAQGTVRPFADVLAYTVDEGRLQNFDIAAVTGDTTHTDLTGPFALSGSGTDPQTLALDLALGLRDSRYDTYAISAADVSATLRGGNLTFDAEADFAEIGRVDAVGSARPFAEPLTYQARGNVRNLDLAALTGDPGQSSDLTGAFDVTGTGTDPQTLALDLRLDLRDSRYRQQQLTAGTVTGTLRSGALDLTVDATTPEGALTFAVAGRPFDEVPTLRLSEGTFRGVNLALVLDNPALQTDLNGRLELDADGFDPQLSDITGRVILLPSRINGARLDAGTVEFDLARGYAEASADLDFEQGAAAFTFSGRPFDERPTYNTAGTLDSLDVAALFGDDQAEATSVNLAFDVKGEGFDPATMTLSGSLRGGDSQLVGATVDTLRTEFALAESVLRLDGLELRSSFADATGEGQIALFDAQQTQRTQLTFDATVKDTAPLNPFLAQPLTLEEGRLVGSVSGEPGRPLRLDVQASAQQFAYGDVRISTLDARLNGEYVGGLADATPVAVGVDSTAADSTAFGLGFIGTARVEFGFLALPSIRIDGGDIDLTYDGENLAASGEIGVDQRRDLNFRLRTDLNPEQQTVTLEALSFRVDGERWELLQESTISYGQQYRFRNLLLYSGDQQIAVDGVVDLDGEQNLVLTVEQFEIDVVTDLVGYDGVGGVLSTTLVLSGPAASPVIDGTLRVDSLVAGGETVGALDLDLDYANFRLTLDALLTHVSGRELRAEGFLPLDFSLGGPVSEAAPSADVDFVVRADSFPVAWAEPFLPPETFTEVGGALDIDLAITGTQSDPQLSGDALLADGRLGVLTLGRTIQDVRIPLTFEGNTVRIREASAGTGGNGRLFAEGTITLPKLSLGELAIALEMDDFNVIETPTYQELRLTTREGPLLFTGTTEFPRLVGALTLDSGDIYLTEELTGPDIAEVELTDAQIQRIEATFGTRITEADTARSVFVQNLALDLDININRNVWLRSRTNPVFDIEFVGTLLVEKAPGGENQLFRSIEVVRGKVELYGRNFDITRGLLTFNGPVSETMIDIEAAFRVPARQGPEDEATIFLTFAGRLGAEGEQAEDGLELTLSADPAMENTDIISYIATGRPAGTAFQGGAGASNLAVSQLASIVEGLAANSLGLDVVEVTQRPDEAIVVTFGSYVTSRTFASVSQVVVEGRGRREEQDGRIPEVTIEYQLLNWLLLRLERRNTGGTGGAAQIELSY
ncbi:MAG: translocation/assembly module TamB domain-containing protein [Rhodothermales bacterium]